MMPVVRLNDATFDDLGSIAKWMQTKTPPETIELLVREKMESLGLERDDGPNPPSEEGSLTFEKVAPGLSFTRVLSASVDGSQLRRPNWARVLRAAIAALKERGMEGPQLVHELQVPSMMAENEDAGYMFHPDLGISIQGQSASDAWREVSRIANKHGIPVEVTFQWYDNEKAQHPGRTGLLRAGTE